MLRLLLWASFASAELFKLDFTKVTFDGPPTKRGGLELGLPIANDIFHQRYLVNLTVGTPPQYLSLTVDTGSADLMLPIYNSSGCAPSCPPGNFTPEDSSTLQATGITYNATFGATYDPANTVIGQYYNDTVTLGGAIAVGDEPASIYDSGIYGLFGLGSRYGEALFVQPGTPYFHNESATFPTIYDQLESLGYTNRKLFSLWLDDQSSATGSLLFGGTDPSKYRGELRSVPVVLSGPIFTSWAVNLTSVTYINSTSGEKQQLTPSGVTTLTVLDSGSPNMYLPTALANNISAQMGATTENGFPYVPCSLRNSHDQFLEFAFGDDSQGPRISVPYPEIIYPFGAPANIGNVTGSDGTPLCYLGLIGTPGNVVLLGDTFLRSAYMVYDVDNLEVSMAPALYNHGY